MKKTVVLLVFSTLLLLGCKTTRVTSVATHEQSVAIVQDSVSISETVSLDTIRTPCDSVSIFISNNWAADTMSLADPAPMSQKIGRSTLKIERKPGGIRVTASCDSLFNVLVNRDREIYRLKNAINAKSSSSIESDKEVITMFRVPLWCWTVMAVSLLANAFIVYLNIKKRLL